MKYDTLNQSLTTLEKSKDDFLRLCRAIDQEIITLDKNNLLQPGDISAHDWTMTFEFNPKFKKELWEAFLPEPDTDYHGFSRMNRDQLEDYIIEKELDIDTEDYKDMALEDLIDAIKDEIGLCKFEQKNDYEIGSLDCKFEHIGLCALKPEKSENAEINIYVEMNSDYSNWPFIKDAAVYLNGKLFLHEKPWEYNEIKLNTYDLTKDIDHKMLAKDIVLLAEKIRELSKQMKI